MAELYIIVIGLLLAAVIMVPLWRYARHRQKQAEELMRQGWRCVDVDLLFDPIMAPPEPPKKDELAEARRACAEMRIQRDNYERELAARRRDAPREGASVEAALWELVEADREYDAARIYHTEHTMHHRQPFSEGAPGYERLSEATQRRGLALRALADRAPREGGEAEVTPLMVERAHDYLLESGVRNVSRYDVRCAIECALRAAHRPQPAGEELRHAITSHVGHPQHKPDRHGSTGLPPSDAPCKVCDGFGGQRYSVCDECGGSGASDAPERDADDRFEQYVETLIAKSPDVQQLGERLADLLSDDDFNSIEPILLGIAAALGSRPVVDEAMVRDAMRDVSPNNWQRIAERLTAALSRTQEPQS